MILHSLYDTVIGIYGNQSAFTDAIEFGINIKQLYNSIKWQMEHYMIDEHTVLR